MIVRHLLLCTAAFLFVTAFPGSPARAQPESLSPYEQQFKEGVSADNIGTYIETLTARPTYPSAPFSEEVARKTLAWFKQWGWDAKIETYEALFPRAVEQTVQLLGPKTFTASIHEGPVVGDLYTENQLEILQPQFMFGPDGDVTAPLVYVNFGLRADYAQLERLGVSVKGKIVIARIGGMWRGGKIQLAAEHGAVGVLLYSDPKEDGYFRDAAYPDGSARTAEAVQRGTAFYGKYPGDPLTPGVASVKGAPRLSKDSPETTIAKIPGAPLSYSDARHFLEALGGQIVPESWRGALPITYRAGPSESRARLKVKYDWKTIPYRDVIAKLPGTTWPDQLIIRGNHRDGWVYGARDPHSGHSAMLEEARGLGQLYRKGWRPKRTIIFASWDGEEQGLIGSTEWTEAHRQQLIDHAVVYMNTDMTGQGTLSGSGSSSLAGFASAVAANVRDPLADVSVLERARVAAQTDIYERPSSSGSGSLGKTRSYDLSRNQLVMGAPGYSSDHQPFVGDIGTATLNLAFGGDDGAGGEYHTSYDDFAFYKKFVDPGFKFGRALAQLNGIALMRLATADVLPMHFGPTADSIGKEVGDVKALYDRIVADNRKAGEALDLNAYAIMADPRRPVTPPRRVQIPRLDFSPLDRAVVAVEAAAARYETAWEALGTKLTTAKIEEINRSLMSVDRAFRRPGGLPARPYYKNELYSPGRLWDTVPVPAVGDAMLDGDWKSAGGQIAPAAGTLTAIAAALDNATAVISNASR